MLLASIRMLAPAFVRLTLVLSVSEAFAALGVAIGAGAVVVYDVRRLRRIHPATVVGTVVVVLSLVVVPTLGRTQVWMELLAALTG